MNPNTALKKLLDGNQRFTQGKSTLDAKELRGSLAMHVKGQNPFAAVLSCADSRVVPEVLFDQGFGDIFTVRVAGNVATPTQIGSIEVSINFGISLIMVLGHSGCGAMNVSLNYEQLPAEARTEYISNLVGIITPAIDSVKNDNQLVGESRLDHAVKQNALYWAEELAKKSPMIKKAINEKKLIIVAAKYDLETGKVEILS